MALFNYATKEITLKVVFYGPGLCGKTTNLQHLHSTMSPEKRSKLLSLSTESDRTLFFDFMPIALGKIKDFDIKFQLYTVPGQVRYNATRKLVLKGADAIVFVADSQVAMRDANIESLQNMKENLAANNIKFDDIPIVLQYNKRDLPNILSVEELNEDLNPTDDKHIEAAAINGMGVNETFKLVTNRLLKHISKKHNVHIEVPEEEAPAAADASFVLDKAGADSKIVNIAVNDKASQSFSEDTHPSETEIEESLLRTSFPEEATASEVPAGWGEPEALEPEAEAPEEVQVEEPSYGWDTQIAEEPAEKPQYEEMSLEEALISEEPARKHEPTVEPEAGPYVEEEGSLSILKSILEEIRESRKQQADIAKALKDLGKALTKKH